MNRRLFLSALTLIRCSDIACSASTIHCCPTLEEAESSPGPKLVLEALAAERMPLWAVVKTDQDLSAADVFELRHYSRPVPWQLDMFRRAGMRVLVSQSSANGLTCLIAFPSLAARHQAWNSLNADLHWPGSSLSQLSLFHRAQK